MNKKQLFLKLLIIVFGGVAVFLLSSCFTTMYVWSCKKSCVESCNSNSDDNISGHEYGIYYTLDNDGEFYWVTEVGYKETEVKIPETYEGLPVMGIKQRAFEHYRYGSGCGGGYDFGMHLSSLTLPKTIKVIDIGVFGGGIDHNYHTEVATCDKLIFEGTIEDWCDIEFRSNPFYGGTKFYIDGELLTDLVIPESVTKINANAFAYYDGLQSVTLHEDITEIGDEAFISCSNIKTITFPCKDLTILQAAFFRCNQLEEVIFTGENLALVDDSIFAWCSALKEVEWNTVRITEIPEYTFTDCYSLGSFVIPASVESIGRNAFEGCYNISEVYNFSGLEVVAGSTSHGGVAYYAGVVHTAEEDNTRIVTDGDFKFVISDERATLFKYTGEGGVLNLPERSGGYDIRDNTFYDNDSITAVNIPKCVTAIGDYAFYSCDSLQLVSGCVGVVTVGNSAFKWCSTLQSVALGSTEEIGDGAFSSCIALTSLELPETLKKIGSGAFNNCEKLTALELPQSLTEIGRGAFADCPAELTYAGTLEQWQAITLSNNPFMTVTVTCSDEVWEGKI